MDIQDFRQALDDDVGICVGYCDVVSAASVEGWAYDRSRPDGLFFNNLAHGRMLKGTIRWI
jgi:hypothetical protein